MREPASKPAGKEPRLAKQCNSIQLSGLPTPMQYSARTLGMGFEKCPSPREGPNTWKTNSIAENDIKDYRNLATLMPNCDAIWHLKYEDLSLPPTSHKFCPSDTW